MIGKRSPSGLGVTDAVYINDQLNRLEKIMGVLNNSVLTLPELERYERLVAKAHQSNIGRVADFPEVDR